CYLSFGCQVSYFFFQAEDGIRVFHVTGVQTCALPIFDRLDADRVCLYEVDEVFQLAGATVETIYMPRHDPRRPELHPLQQVEVRSEERRVGDECGSSWWKIDSRL